MTYKILVVDDQAEVRKVIELSLDASHYEIFHANDWMTAMAMTRTVKPDLMLLDLIMPGEFDGLEVCKRIKSDPVMSSIQVIIISARSTTADRQQGMLAGADDYMIKPFSPLALAEKVEQLISKRFKSSHESA